MRVNRLIRIGRLEIYVGRRPDNPVIWSHGRVNVGRSAYELWLGRSYVVVAWVRRRLSDAELDAELEAAAARLGVTKEQLLAVAGAPSGDAGGA